MVSNNLKEKVLELEIRNRIFILVSRFAGSHLRELERLGKIPYSTLKYHLHFLVRRGVIVEKIGGGNVRYFPGGTKAEDIEILGLLRQRNVRKILLFMLIEGDCGIEEIKNYLVLSMSTTSWYLEKLGRLGVVERKNNDGKLRFSLKIEKDRILKILIAHRESFVDKLVDKVVEMWDGLA